MHLSLFKSFNPKPKQMTHNQPRLLAFAGICAALSCLSLNAQDLDRLEPKTFSSEEEAPQQTDNRLAKNQDPAREKVVLDSLKGLVLLQNPENLNTSGLSFNGVIAEGYQPKDLFDRLSPFIGKSVSLSRLDDIVREIVLAYRASGSPVVDAYVPNQDITTGTVQVVIVEGKVGDVRVEGNCWFKDEQILSSVEVSKDSTVDSVAVTRDIAWLNRNPFRHTDLVLTRGEKPGTTDVVLKTNDRMPLRVYAGYENTGTDETGEDRVQAGLNWGNAFNLGHLLDYQYTGSTDHKKLMGHSLRYTADLPWRDTLVFSASYSESKPEIDPFELEATSYALSGRYIMPLVGRDSYDHRFIVGVDYKFSDSNLEFSNIPVFGKKTQILQFAAGYGASMQDSWGQTSFGGQFVYSPGDLLRDNSAKAFNEVRFGADAEYSYIDLNISRYTRLPSDFSWRSKVKFKFSDGLLIGSEQIGLGGYYSIRGFDERELNGDVGFAMNNDIFTPTIRLDSLFGQGNLNTNLQFLGFWDYGFAEQKGARRFHMSSVGAGMRVQVRDNLSIKLDYGWQLSGEDIDDSVDSKGHLSATLSY